METVIYMDPMFAILEKGYKKCGAKEKMKLDLNNLLKQNSDIINHTTKERVINKNGPFFKRGCFWS